MNSAKDIIFLMKIFIAYNRGQKISLLYQISLDVGYCNLFVNRVIVFNKVGPKMELR